jgi:hypothetical protein
VGGRVGGEVPRAREKRKEEVRRGFCEAEGVRRVERRAGVC